MNTLSLWSLAATAAIGLLGCNGPTVVQGHVVSFDSGSKALVVKDERPPNADLSINTTGADIGAEPSVGDVVRVAYRNEGGALHATRVMNVTKQDDRKKSSGGH